MPAREHSNTRVSIWAAVYVGALPVGGFTDAVKVSGHAPPLNCTLTVS